MGVWRDMAVYSVPAVILTSTLGGSRSSGAKRRRVGVE